MTANQTHAGGRQKNQDFSNGIPPQDFKRELSGPQGMSASVGQLSYVTLYFGMSAGMSAQLRQ